MIPSIDQPPPIITDPNDPRQALRSDLWPTMSISELTQQQDLVITKLSTLHALLSSGGGQSIRGIYMALQTAMQDLTQLIDNRSVQNKKHG